MLNQQTPVAITGATGALGSRVAARLAATGVAQRLIVRDRANAPRLPHAEVAVAAGYDDLAAMTAALRGCDTMLFVSARESATRIAEHKSVVDAAIAANVKHIVYTSILHAWADATFTLAHDHYATEQYIAACGLGYTFLENSFYAELLQLMASPQGLIAGPGGNGAFATFADVAAILTRVTGRSVTYKDETIEEAYASRASYGAAQVRSRCLGFDVHGDRQWRVRYGFGRRSVTARPAGDPDRGRSTYRLKS